MRTLYDAADILNIPRDATLIAYYDDGSYVPSRGDMALFPHARFVPITVFPNDDRGIVFDGPPDNASWPQVVGWVAMRRRSGADPTVYTDNDQWATGRAAFDAQHVPQPHWWIADWNGNASIPPGAIAHQYRGNPSGGFDLSVVADYWPGVDNAPAPTPAPTPAPPAPQIEEDEMLMVQVAADPANPGTNQGVWLLSGSLYAHIPQPSDTTALGGAGVKSVTWSFAMHQATLAASAALHGTLSGSLGVNGTLAVS